MRLLLDDEFMPVSTVNEWLQWLTVMGGRREDSDREEQKENPSVDARPTEEKGEAALLVSKSKHEGSSSSSTTREEISIRECSSSLSDIMLFHAGRVLLHRQKITQKHNYIHSFKCR